MNALSPFYPAKQGVLFVKRKVVARLFAKQNDDLFEVAFVFPFNVRFGFHGRDVLKKSHEFSGQLFCWRHDIGNYRIDRAAGHPVKFCRSRILHQHRAVLFFNGFQSQAAVASHAGQDDADAVLLPVGCQ